MSTQNHPNFLISRPYGSASGSSTPPSSSHNGLMPNTSSPRKPHVDGDIPPELSPLDAFALQGHLLAKQLDQASRDGRRVSRLPPTAITDSFAQPRPGYLRSISADEQNFLAAGPPPQRPAALPPSLSFKGELEAPSDRPMSIHPRMSRVPFPPNSNYHQPPYSRPDSQQHLFDRRRKSSERLSSISRNGSTPAPEPAIQSARMPSDTERGDLSMRPKRSFDSQLQRPLTRDLSVESAPSRRYHQSNALAPPGSPPQARYASSIRSVPPDASDDEGETSSVGGGSFISYTNKPSPYDRHLSNATPPPFSPFVPPRSPSIDSEYSVASARLPRPSFNFSRPLSRASRPSFDLPRQETPDPSSYFTNDETSGGNGGWGGGNTTVQTPVSLSGDEKLVAPPPLTPAGAADSTTTTPTTDNESSTPASTYIYSRFALPRGRALQRNSVILLEGADAPRRSNETTSSTTLPIARERFETTSTATAVRPASPLSPPRSVPHEQAPVAPRSSTPSSTSSPTQRRPATSSAGASPSTPTKPPSTLQPPATTTSTKRPTTASASDLSAEEHLSKGIACHEAGSLNESTYHLRIAAKQNHPTAMLLYALACRHGWGMRPQPREGVSWLRKAADCASLEVADDEDNLGGGGGGADYNERKARRAQFALSIYELGVSHMNGWGIEQDKTLALRCFEIAASWGDGDAMAEAGFCYAKGVGARKDLMKAARFYRAAEGKGVSMVGNSWIYKSKYNDDSSSSAAAKDKDKERSGRSRKKEENSLDGGSRLSSDAAAATAIDKSSSSSNKKPPRDKSRTRTVFGRKKSVANTAAASSGG